MGWNARWGQVGHGDMVSGHSSLEPGAEVGDGAWCQPGSRCPIKPADPASCPHSSVVMLEIDNRLCLQLPENDHCFPDAQSAADYLGALSAVERLDFPYPLWAARGEPGRWATSVGRGSLVGTGPWLKPCLSCL